MPTKPPSASLQEKREVQEILESLKADGGVKPLRELIARLNYDRLDSPVKLDTSAKSGFAAKEALAAGPTLLGEAHGFYVIYSRLASDKLRLTDERAVVSELLKQYPYALFVFANKRETDFHFVNVKWEVTAKRRLYRRISVGPQERLRTAVERMEMLDVEKIPQGLFGVTAQEMQDQHDRAFDVSKVTKDFYAEYKRVFEVVKDAVKGFGTSDEEQARKHLFVQRLFNRLMFLRFIQKKGWLEIDGSTDYLAALWASHGREKQQGKNFYADRLGLLFSALDDERASGALFKGGKGAVEATIGKVKYLNGGLFEPTAEDRDPKVKIADTPFQQIFSTTNGLFETFNFTITESTPLDVEIAVDPEMLGKIFEELVTGRHDSGSYYTPKPIVSFMCREALKGYLETQVPTESKEAMAKFVDKHEPESIRDGEAVLAALKRVTVCDPACGSGAYLLGMMHELLDLRQCLFQTRQLDAPSVYERKLQVIQTNIYGVDIAEFAVNIARLRLWLSLAVDYDGPEPQPLPNLDYKIEVGDSVCSPSPGALQIGLQQKLVDDFLEAKRKYLVAHHSDKQVLRKRVEELRADIMAFSNRTTEDFDWVVNFAEVFVEGGFDIVIANPPYVRMELFKAIKPILRRNFPDVHSDRADLYCYFYARGHELLREFGSLAFISPNKWLRAMYGARLRAALMKSLLIRNITDFGDLPVFESVSAYPQIFTARRSATPSNQRFRYLKVESLAEPYPDINALLEEQGSDLTIAGSRAGNWDLDATSAHKVTEGVDARFTTLSKLVDGKFLYGVKTGLNDAFVIDRRTRADLIKVDAASKAFIKPLFVGKTIRKWLAEETDQYLIYVPHGKKPSSAILQHLKAFKSALEARATKQAWYELQQPQSKYAVEFTNAKIIYPIIASDSRFCLSTNGSYINNRAFAIPSSDLFLLGVLNSRYFWQLIESTCSPLRGGYYELLGNYLSRMPIPIPPSEVRLSVIELVQRCLDRKGVDCEDLERQINERVDALYGLKA